MSLKKEKRSIEATLTDSEEEADTSHKQKDSFCPARPVANNDRLYSSSGLYSKFANLGETINKKMKNEDNADFNDLKHKFDLLENETETLNNNKKLKTEPSTRTNFADKMMVSIFFSFFLKCKREKNFYFVLKNNRKKWVTNLEKV